MIPYVIPHYSIITMHHIYYTLSIYRFKFGNVSPRHTYGDDEIIGFEFRSSIDSSMSIYINTVASFLQGWTHYNLPTKSDMQYQRFKIDNTISDATYNLKFISLEYHMRESFNAYRAVKKIFKSAADSCLQAIDCVLPWHLDPDMSTTLMMSRWGMMAIQWESHPSVVARCIGNDGTAPWNSAQSITQHREAAYVRIRNLVFTPSTTAKMKMSLVNTIVSDFFKGLYLCF